MVDFLGLCLAMFSRFHGFFLTGLPGPLVLGIGLWCEMGFGHHGMLDCLQ
jgi:hypothetical protein